MFWISSMQKLGFLTELLTFYCVHRNLVHPCSPLMLFNSAKFNLSLTGSLKLQVRKLVAAKQCNIYLVEPFKSVYWIQWNLLKGIIRQ